MAGEESEDDWTYREVSRLKVSTAERSSGVSRILRAGSANIPSPEEW